MKSFPASRALAAVLGVAVLALAVFGGCVSCGHAATLRISCTAPTLDNGGTCIVPLLAPAVDSVWIFFEVPGPAIRDSVRVLPGTPVLRAYSLPPGTYSFRAYAARFLKDGTKVVSCDTTATRATFSQPGAVLLTN